MKSIKNKLDNILERKSKAPHDKAAIVDEIKKVIPTSERYGYTFWLKKIGDIPGGVIMKFLDGVQKNPVKFRGGILTRLLDKNRSKFIKKEKQQKLL